MESQVRRPSLFSSFLSKFNAASSCLEDIDLLTFFPPFFLSFFLTGFVCYLGKATEKGVVAGKECYWNGTKWKGNEDENERSGKMRKKEGRKVLVMMMVMIRYQHKEVEGKKDVNASRKGHERRISFLFSCQFLYMSKSIFPSISFQFFEFFLLRVFLIVPMNQKGSDVSRFDESYIFKSDPPFLALLNFCLSLSIFSLLLSFTFFSPVFQ